MATQETLTDLDHDPYICDCDCHDALKRQRQKEEEEAEKLRICELERQRHMEIMRMREKLYSSKKPSKGLVMVRMPTSMLQRFINSICSQKRVLQVYTGKTFCYTKNMKKLGGQGWDEGFSLGVVAFDDFKLAGRWFQSDIVCNQHDWLDGVDIVAVPERHAFRKKGFTYSSMGTFVINDPEVFYEDFLHQVLPDIKKAGGHVVVASPAVEKFRGVWDAGYFMLVQWKSEKDFFAYSNSAATSNTDKWCMESSCGCMTLTDLETNIPASASYKRPPVCPHPH